MRVHCIHSYSTAVIRIFSKQAKFHLIASVPTNGESYGGELSLYFQITEASRTAFVLRARACRRAAGFAHTSRICRVHSQWSLRVETGVSRSFGTVVCELRPCGAMGSAHERLVQSALSY